MRPIPQTGATGGLRDNIPSFSPDLRIGGREGRAGGVGGGRDLQQILKLGMWRLVVVGSSPKSLQEDGCLVRRERTCLRAGQPERGVAVPALAGLVRGAVVTVVFAPPDPAWTVAASGAGSRREEVLI